MRDECDFHPMTESPVDQHRRYFRQLRTLRRLLSWEPAYFFAAAHLARISSPVRHERDKFEAAWRLLGHANPREIWGRFLQRVGVSTAAAFLQGDGSHLPVCIDEDDPEGVLAHARRHGTLFLTYHHQFAYLFCSALGHLGVPLNALTMDPALGPLHALLPEFGKNIFGDSERHFRGGRYYFLNPDNPRFHLLHVLRDLLRGTSIVSANDFDNPFPQFKSHPGKLLGAVIDSPTGVIPFALQHPVMISAGYLDWQGGNRFKIFLRVLKRPDEQLSLAEVYARYMAQLEEIALRRPEIWEGLLGLKESPYRRPSATNAPG